MTRDPKETQAREAHRDAKRAEASAARFRATRDHLISELRKHDPDFYTHARLAKIVRCSPELIAHILRTARRKTSG